MPILKYFKKKFENRLNSLNSGCVINIGNRPQNGPSVYNGANGHTVADRCIERRISVFGTLPVLSEFTLNSAEWNTKRQTNLHWISLRTEIFVC